MNNDELKKKIADIIYHTGCTGACCECDYSKHSDADTYCKAILKASALISEGIGDVKEAKFEADHYWRMWQGALVELERAEHRAEVAERKGMTDEKVYSVDEVNHLISEMDKVIAKLKTENVALRERLEMSVELPVNIGDVKYLISSDKSCVLEEKVIAVQATKYEYSIEVDEIDAKNQYGTIESFKIKQWNGDMFFKTREAAEARLAELKGE